jgi:phosphoribosylformylglycinamidine synthase
VSDSVKHAAATPDVRQPYEELGLTGAEYQKIRDILGRRPTAAELALYSVMWSEHCSYKSSKVHLRQFGQKAPKTSALLAGIGANAGVVDIGGGYAVTFKIESHNHPSFVEPLQGAATGVGGIVRDILAMGARPAAVMDALRFGPADAPDTHRVLPGVVSGVSWYGNCLGLPNIGGELAFDPCYAGNPLVNALCVGVMRHGDLQEAKATGVGNKVILFGSRTGPDGVGGASVLASFSFGNGETGKAKRPSVQVGDPFMEKLLVECCLELYAAGLIEGIQDLGAAGVACATTELAAAGDGGMRVALDTVPLRDPALQPAEILMSESQERMMAVVAPTAVMDFMNICRKWDVEATVIGEVTSDERLVMTWHGETVVDLPPRTAADGPVYDRTIAVPAGQEVLAGDDPLALRRPATADELRADLIKVFGAPEQADPAWVTSQYDWYVRGNTVLAMREDGGVLRVDDESGLGIALATDGNGRYCQLDPYKGTQLVLSEAYRNVAMTGARPLAVTNCLNFGSPEDPGVMWQFSQAVTGLADGCAELGTPVTGGNVSFYNQTDEEPIFPTPVVGVLGVLSDVRRRVPSGFRKRESSVILLGETKLEIGGSAWAYLVHEHLGGKPPEPDLDAERRLAALIAGAAQSRLLDSAHDLSDGGLAIALAESCSRGVHGCRVTLPGDPFTYLFSESAARAVVSTSRPDEFLSLAATHEVPAKVIGFTGGDALEITGLFEIGLGELSAVHQRTLPAIFG